MPFEHVLPETIGPLAERRAAGRDLRKAVPRRAHAVWKASPSRHDPVQRLIESNRHLISSLVPVRYGRMQLSVASFFRGAACIMAADLAETPCSGLWAQASGDCHLRNFGIVASDDAAPIFDLNDFDETLRAPFEWDVKRLAASFAVEARARRLGDKTARSIARTAVMSYRLQMEKLSQLDPLASWHVRIDASAALDSIEDTRQRNRLGRRIAEIVEADCSGYRRIIEKRRGSWRIQEHPTTLRPLRGQEDDTYEIAARTAFMSYRAALPEHQSVLLDRYELADVAMRVVGVASVGTFCAIGLFVTKDDAPLLLQVKEARPSLLEPFVGPSRYRNHAQRVVVGQRLMQGQRDLFLGWTQACGDDQPCYVRRLRDHGWAVVGEELVDDFLAHHAMLCGAALARAHARSGDAAQISGYAGSGGAFDAAIADFAVSYAKQVERDWQMFRQAIEAGIVEARPE